MWRIVLLYVWGPEEANEAQARGFYDGCMEAFARLAPGLRHPRTGDPLRAVATRLDQFLAGVAPSSSPRACGLRIAVPSEERCASWCLALRPSIKTLIMNTFPVGDRVLAGFDPVGPRTHDPSAGRLADLREIVDLLEHKGDPAHPPVDPRMWLVLAPPLPRPARMVILPSFLRAEPFARVVSVQTAPSPGGLERWLAGEIEPLMAGKDLATDGLVVTSSDLEPPFAEVDRDARGRREGESLYLEPVAGLEEMYVWRIEIDAGQLYSRLHSHSASEELYWVLEGRGLLRVNERLLSIAAGDCFGKPRGYDCSTQILNPGPGRMVLLDVGTWRLGEVDLCHYPEHGEMVARFGGMRWVTPTESITPPVATAQAYFSRYFRVAAPHAATTADPEVPTGGSPT